MRSSWRIGDSAFVAAAAFLLGIFEATYGWSFCVGFVILIIFVICARWLVIRHQHKNRIADCGVALFIIGIFFLGNFYYRWYLGSSNTQTSFPSAKNSNVLGVVTSQPKETENSTMLTVALSSPFHGDVSVFIPKDKSFSYGDLIEMTGTFVPSTVAGEDPALIYPRLYRLSSNKGSVLESWILSFRDFITHQIDQLFPQDEAQLLEALLLGNTNTMSVPLKEQMEASGTSYVVAMYGYKMTLIAFLISESLKDVLPRSALFALILMMLIIFVAISGSVLSAIRAGIAAFLGMVAKYSGRTFTMRNAVTFTATIIVIFDPTTLGSAAFQLSFLSLLGIFYLGPPLKKLLHIHGEGFLKWKEHVVMATSANLAIVPVVIGVFGQFSLTSFISNVLIVIPLPALLLLGIVISVANIFSSYGVLVLVRIVGIIVNYQLAVIRFFSLVVVPLPSILGSSYFILTYYIALSVFIFYEYERIDKKY